MKKSTAFYFKIILLLTALFYVVALITDNSFMSDTAKVVALISLIVILLLKKLKDSFFLLLFLISFLIGDLSSLYVKLSGNEIYPVNSVFCIISYTCLFIYIILGLNFRELLKRFSFHIFVLSAMTIYLLYTLDGILKFHGTILPMQMYVVESFYNLSLLLVMSISFLYYLYKMSKKSLFLFLGSTFLCFSEFTLVVYIFAKKEFLIDIMYSIFLILSFYFIYMYIENVDAINEEELLVE